MKEGLGGVICFDIGGKGHLVLGPDQIDQTGPSGLLLAHPSAGGNYRAQERSSLNSYDSVFRVPASKWASDATLVPCNSRRCPVGVRWPRLC